jgi:hypothetical protein
MRVAEIMTDFHRIQNFILSIRASPSAEEYNEDGFALLRRCVHEAQALLAPNFQQQAATRGDDEQTKLQLRR